MNKQGNSLVSDIDECCTARHTGCETGTISSGGELTSANRRVVGSLRTQRSSISTSSVGKVQLVSVQCPDLSRSPWDAASPFVAR